MTALRVAIVGLGRAGARNAAVLAPDGRRVHRNHLSGALAAGAQIVALVDRDVEVRTAALSAWREQVAGPNADALPALGESITDIAPGSADVIVLASPPYSHAAQLEDALACRPSAVLVEKPLAVDLATAERMAAHAEVAGTTAVVHVNFNRRADKGMREWCAHWQGRSPRAVVMRYGNGLFNYASHLVDHALDWFGVPQAVRALPPFEVRQPRADSPSFLMEFDRDLNVHVIGLDDIDYDMFEMDLYFPDGVASARNNAAEKFIYRRQADLYYPGYAGVVSDETVAACEPIGGFEETYRVLTRHLGEGAHAGSEDLNLCSLSDALWGMRVLDAVERSRATQGRPINVAEAATTTSAAISS